MRDNPDLSRFLQRLATSLAQADPAGLRQHALFSLTLDVAGLRLGALPQLEPPFVYWRRPERDSGQLGVGEVWRLVADGPGRFDRLIGARRKLRESWCHRNETGHDAGDAALFCAMAFDPGDRMQGRWGGLPNSLLLLPRLLLNQAGERTTLTLSCTTAELKDRAGLLADWSRQTAQLFHAAARAEADPATQALQYLTPPDDEAWNRVVRTAIADIGSGRLEKVVTARSIRVEADRPFVAAAVLARLEQLYPSCRLLAVALDGRTLISATPERLAAVRAGAIECDALGGTSARDRDPRHDHSLSLRLLNSRKARHEHALVVNSIREALAPLCEQLAVPESPGIERLRNLQHLRTTIGGVLQEGVGLLEAARRLHPTPAVAGTPTPAACDWLRRHERLARGWYSGIAGWLQPGGDGELAVLLRCALLDGRQAELYAGAGIVADSEPLEELQETGMKLRAMLEAMQGNGELPQPDRRASVERRAGRS